MNWYKKSNWIENITPELLAWKNQFSHSQIMTALAMQHIMQVGMNSQTSDFHYPTMPYFYLTHGKLYESAELTPEEQEKIESLYSIFKRGEVKECFYSSQLLMLHDNDFKYVEGYAGTFFRNHGWNSLNGKVIDITPSHLTNDQPVYGVIPNGIEYFGVEMPKGRVQEVVFGHGQGHSLIDNDLNNFEMLQEDFNIDYEWDGEVSPHAFEDNDDDEKDYWND